ncbi:hypothetical protein [Streptomyces sp. NPDC090022]|uniref:hypothetical protein n=1 Tax=Streptomyces sp. NPDC090022 TaxID=3365920 RepID=UPI003824F97C
MKRSRVLAVVVPSLLLAATLGATSAAATPRAPYLPNTAATDHETKPVVPHCLGPDGADLNKRYRVTQRIIGPAACRTAFNKADWVRVVPEWSTAAKARGARYPAGYRPDRSNPIDDFNAKFVSVTYVHDIGTPHERSLTYPKKQVLRTGFTTPDGLPSSGIVSPPLKALGLGTHTTTVFVELRAEHCDGLATVREENCLPAGISAYTGDIPIDVIPRPREIRPHG